MFRLRKKKNLSIQKLIEKSGLFDKVFYLKIYHDVRLADMTAIEHYARYGIKEDRKPNATFDPIWYREFYQDVKTDGIFPFVHYIKFGKKENRYQNFIQHKDSQKYQTPKDAFDKAYYLSTYSDIKEARIDPYDHYINQGWKEGRKPNPWFDPSFYLKKYNDIKEEFLEPLTHYIQTGQYEGRQTKYIPEVSKKSFFSYINKQNSKEDYQESFVEFFKHDKVNTDIKLIAWYLPQFHPIPQNDYAWGKGFTEWTNVSKALPQFEGHYQPRLPGELGYYDLRMIDVQKRQIELARNYGLHGFCYHYYWFDGQKVMDRPLQQILDNPDLDFPFCINWANENWTKRWDGLDQEVILQQNHTPEDDIAFLEGIQPILTDKRYIRINGKPLLMLYRPSLFPDIHATVKRWRKHALKIGIGELYLVMTHSFENIDPTSLGFDAAVDFAPNQLKADNISDQQKFYNENFSGNVYDYDSLVKYSMEYEEPPYTKFRSLCPSWDNGARKPGKGTVFQGATPSRYKKWLEYLTEYTHLHRSVDEKFLFINAWNEWAEGAYLEPDRKYGYAYLEATHQVMLQYSAKPKIVFVSHDAHFHGAQILSLNIVRVLHTLFKLDVHMLLKSGGVLEEQYKAYATVYNLERDYNSEEIKALLMQNLFELGAKHAICNTVVSGDIAAHLKQAGMKTISLIHELPNLIKRYNMEDNVKLIADTVDHVVFPSTYVQHGFEVFVDLAPEKVAICPQGLYQKNPYQNHLNDARNELRQGLGLSNDAKIVLGAGFADHRKGIDLFIEIANASKLKIDNVYFVWVGDIEASMQKYINKTFDLDTMNMIFVPAKPEISIFYSGADIYLMTSREDPFPSVVLEAMNAKVPVIGFENAGGFRDIVTKDTGILVPFEDVGAMTDAVVELLRNNKDRMSLGENCAALINEKFVWKDYIYNLLELVGMPYKKVSVVVPNYNYERYILDRLKTIEQQSYPVYEVLYLEDCSTDNSLEIAKDFLFKTNLDMKVIENASNSGSVFKQWAKGITLANSEYIWIAEADDLADPDFLSEVMRSFDDSEVVLSYAQSSQIDQNGDLISNNYLDYTNDIDIQKWREPYIRNGKDELADTLVVKNTIPNVSAVVFKKYDISPILDKLLTFKVAGDWYFYSWLLQKGRIAYNPKELNTHRRHNGSVTVSSENNCKHFDEIIEMQELIKNTVKVSNDLNPLIDSFRKSAQVYLQICDNESDTIDTRKSENG